MVLRAALIMAAAKVDWHLLKLDRSPDDVHGFRLRLCLSRGIGARTEARHFRTERGEIT